jgi:hypothetical protein
MTRTRYLLTIALLCVPSCHEWHQVARPGASGSLEGNPEIARVTRTVGCGATPNPDCVGSRDTLTLYNPKVQGDSLMGYYDRNQRTRVAMHVRDVINVESRKINAARTAGLALGTGAFIALVYLAVILVLLGQASD